MRAFRPSRTYLQPPSRHATGVGWPGVISSLGYGTRERDSRTRVLQPYLGCGTHHHHLAGKGVGEADSW